MVFKENLIPQQQDYKQVYNLFWTKKEVKFSDPFIADVFIICRIKSESALVTNGSSRFWTSTDPQQICR